MTCRRLKNKFIAHVRLVKKPQLYNPFLEAISLYASRAAEKLRYQNHLVKTLHVFLHTSPFAPNYYSNAITVQLPYPTDDTRLIVRYAKQSVSRLYKPGFAFLKAGVGFIELTDKRFHQLDWLQPVQSQSADKLMYTLDRINRLNGKNTVFLASQGFRQPWAMRQQYTSPAYTTRWSQVPTVKAI